MPEEVKIVVRQESQGSALRDTKRELDDVTQAGNQAATAAKKAAASSSIRSCRRRGTATRPRWRSTAAALRSVSRAPATAGR